MISRAPVSRCTLSRTSRRVAEPMPRIQIQFHAEPGEILTLASQWAREHDVTSIVVEQFFPHYRALAAGNGGVHGVRRKLERIDRVVLCQQDPDLRAETAHGFVTLNPGCLFVSIGARDAEGLRESALGGATDDKGTLDLWRSVVRQGKRGMHKGASVRNPYTGAVDHVPNHLHTRGAHELAEKGVTMLAAAGSNQFEFDDCPRTDQNAALRSGQS